MHVELQTLKLGALKKRGRRLGATADQLEAVDDADDPKAAAIDLVLALRTRLDGMKLGALKKLLRSQGADDDQMEVIDDSDDPKAAAIQMIVQADSPVAPWPRCGSRCLPTPLNAHAYLVRGGLISMRMTSSPRSAPWL